MAVTLYTLNLDRWFLWDDGVTIHRALLLQPGYVVDPDHEFVSDLTDEITVVGYGRQTLTSKTATPSLPDFWITYDADDPAFGVLTAGETVAAMVLYEFVTTDADSPLLQYMPITPNVPTAGAPFPVGFDAAGVHRSQAV